MPITLEYEPNSVYLRRLSYGSYIYLPLYVDDILVACKNKVEIEKSKTQLSSKFEMKDLGEVKKIPGMEIVGDRVKGIVHLT